YGIIDHMQKPLVTILGKAVRNVARLRGGGSALPGLVVERIDPNFIKATLASLPFGVVIISGTNGKTTTTKMVVELLEGQGLKVFTNRTGSNFTRGVAAALLGDIDMKGTLHADIAVLELDEAHATKFVDKIPPRYSLILNVMRDQLDRFGEIDYTTNLLRHIAMATTGAVVLNREDARVASIAHSLDDQKITYFGLDDKLLSTFPSDDNLRSRTSKRSSLKAEVVLSAFAKDTATFTVGDEKMKTKLKLTGIYNVFNAAAALALVREIVGKNIDKDAAITSLSQVTPAFGRGETIIVNDQPLELVLVKNPSGFRLGLESFNSKGYATMIAINDNYADGRDMSWLWDVEFTSLKQTGVSQVSGIRAYDMALRLQYDEIAITNVQPDLKKALKRFLTVHTDQPKRIYCTYTAMLTLRKQIGKIAHVEVVS
ncbi:MAG TPA: MurT ligase domain-containing protein, partial [Candidatus Saccharimonadales bacterium]|nr:MurT ligase domain-containing protein [Candidatus Saccharimonadales bacterium]